MPWGHGRPVNEARMIAEINGERTYRGSTHGCGTNERYTIGGACVYCARRVQREQREARVADLERLATDANPWD
jgi:hypothetical protein